VRGKEERKTREKKECTRERAGGQDWRVCAGKS